jgi:hypothetical protein
VEAAVEPFRARLQHHFTGNPFAADNSIPESYLVRQHDTTQNHFTTGQRRSAR